LCIYYEVLTPFPTDSNWEGNTHKTAYNWDEMHSTAYNWELNTNTHSTQLVINHTYTNKTAYIHTAYQHTKTQTHNSIYNWININHTIRQYTTGN